MWKDKFKSIENTYKPHKGLVTKIYKEQLNTTVKKKKSN